MLGMQSSVHRSFTPVWRWLCLMYVCLGVAVLTEGLRLGLWLPVHVPLELLGLVWLVCAAGTWQGKYAGVRGACSILPLAISAIGYAVDWLIITAAPGPQSCSDLADLSQGVLWGAACMVVASLTKLDAPRD